MTVALSTHDQDPSTKRLFQLIMVLTIVTRYVYCFSDKETTDLLRHAIAQDDENSKVAINLNLTVNVGGQCDAC